MSSCPLYNSNNLDYTGNKMNNPYLLIQKAGKRKTRRTRKRSGKKTRKTRRTRKTGKEM
jgi:hypothetical protein